MHHDYDDIPGTFVFDAERSRQGYGINMLCMSLTRKRTARPSRRTKQNT
jgi:protocatechuate 4,5-dioxygenase alpha chain